MQVTSSNTPPFTPQNLISNVFLGDGVEVLNITYNGQPVAVGYFTDGTQAIGIDRGIVMTSGYVATGAGPFGLGIGCNGLGADFATNPNLSTATDADLANQVPNSTIMDVAVYTITFIPTSDTLRFRYVFGSEEYPEFACSAYNDVFGFFIQGPGYPTPTNIAIIPGTNLPVTINNLHPDNNLNYPPCNPFNEQFYNDNNFTGLQPTYDGFTDVFTAEAVVTPCQQYTIKLAIADAGDEFFDSGVFLEAKSFGTRSLDVKVATVSLDGAVVEGCAQGSLTFSLPEALTQNFNIDYNIGGSATNGVDYQAIPLNLSIPAGQTEITVPIIGIEDNMAEAPEEIVIDVQLDFCKRDTFRIGIKDNGLIKPNLPADTTFCTGAPPLQLDGTVPVSLPQPPIFTNTQDFQINPVGTAVTSPINVSGIQPATLDSGVIRSICLNITHPSDGDLDIFLISPGGQFLELSTDNGANGDNYTNTCFTQAAIVPINSPGPTAPATAAPFTGDWLPEGPWSDLWDGDYPTNGVWRLQAIDDMTNDVGTLLDWTITFEPTYKIDYQWSPATGLSCLTCPITVASPAQTTTYTVIATDSYGCTVSDTVTIDIATALPAPVVTCVGSTSSTVDFNWTTVPGASSYQVNINGTGWTNVGATTSYQATGLAPGSSVTVEVQGISAQSNCNSIVGTVTCATCAPPTATFTIGTVSCFGQNNGSITVVPDGANPPYTFALGAQTNSTGIFQNLAAGIHVITVTDASGCSDDFQIDIASPAQLTATASVQQNVSCFGGNNASANVVANGGTGTLDYLWNDPAGQTTNLAVNLAAGNYTVTVTDDNGCSATSTATVTQPNDLVLNAIGSLALCFGQASGSASASATGGITPYVFAWSNGVNGPQNPNIPAGNYFVTITDGNGCAETAFVSVGQPTQLTATATATPADCNDSSDGTATVAPGGGTTPYSYFWSDPTGQTSATATNLVAGTYTVTITDANGCSLTQTATVTSPTALTATLTKTNVSCFGGNNGSATIAPAGGTLPYSFKWSDPAGQTSATATNLVGGNYSVTVTDQNGCTLVVSTNIGQPEALSLTSSVTHVSCFGEANGQITTQSGGGTPPLVFAWSSGEITPNISGKTAGGYTLTLTDANGCTAVLQNTITEPTELVINANAQSINCFGNNDGSIELTSTGGTPGYNVLWSGPNGFSSTLSNLSNLSAGSYNATVTDNAGCSKTLTAEVGQPVTSISLNLPEIADTICFSASNGTATVVPSGGMPPYTYVWDANGQTTATATGLSSAPYHVTVTDANGCTQLDSTFILQKEELFAFAEAAPPPCHDLPQGTASVTAIFYGATNADPNDFNYLWSSVPPQSGQNAIGLEPNETYSVTVTDALGCSDVQTVTVGNAPEFIAQIADSENVRCFGENTGWAVARGVGGTAPYSWFWSAGNQTDSIAQNLSAGTYTVTVTDANDCPATTTVTIVEPPALSLDVLPTDVKCFGENSGKAKAVASGGTSPYTYIWWNGGQTQEIQNLAAGVIGLTLVDANGCQVGDSAEIEQPASAVTGTAEAQAPKCFGGHDGEINITASGGTLPYRYALDNGPFNGSPKQIGIGAGTYTPKIMDKNGCVFELPPITVEQPAQLTVELGPTVTIELGQNTQLFAQVFNANGPVTYSWTPSDSVWLSCLDCLDPHVDSLYYQNWFEVRVTDSLGCRAEDRILVNVEKPRKIFVPTAFSPDGDFNNDRLIVHGQQSARVLDFRIFDRWGELVFEGKDFALNDTDTGWDGEFRGKPMDPGVYVWVLEVEYMDGAREVFKGNTILIR